MKSILLFLLLYSTYSVAQPALDVNKGDTAKRNAGLEKLISKIDRYRLDHPNERVYLHLDRQGYLPGDTIWYKAYTVIGSHHQLSVLSGVLYVELIGPKDNVITRQVLSLKSGTAAGDIQLSPVLSQGVYRLRAYTRWMENNGAADFYDESIRIGLPANTRTVAQNHTPDIRFFPEGGTLVNGVRSKIAVKAVDTTGLGIDVTGAIEDNTGNVLTDFSTRHLGMGVFALTPENGKTYKAVIKGPGEAAYTVSLPLASENGLTLAVNNNSPDSIFIKVATNTATLSAQLGAAFYILTQSGGKLFYSAAGRLNGPIFTASLDKKRFPAGVARFTLFSQNNEPVAERLAFIDNDDTLKLSINKPQIHIAGQMADEGFKVTNYENTPVAANFSISVVNEDDLIYDSLTENTIFTDLLLKDEVKGNIEKPGYYFTNPTPASRADLDVLLLTQGYRSFEWKNVLTDSVTAPGFQSEKGLGLSGRVQTDKGKPVGNVHIMLAAIKERLYIDTTTDARGRFRFTGLDLPDSTKIMLRMTGGKAIENIKITIDTPYYPAIETSKGLGKTAIELVGEDTTHLGKNYEDMLALRMAQKAKQLKEVTIKGQKTKTPDVPYSDNLNGPGHADQVFTSDQLVGYNSLSDALVDRITGVTFDIKTNLPSLIRGQTGLNPSPMVLIVDGVPESISHLDDLTPDEVNTVEVLMSGAYLAIYGSNAPGGALVVTTKKTSGITATDIHADILTCWFKGYYQPRSFYTPKYAVNQPADNSPATIYWNPNINSDSSGNALLKYTGGLKKGNYRLVVEGIDDAGDLGRLVYRYKIE